MSTSPHPADAAASPRARSNLHVAIVEDDADLRVELVDGLRGHGFQMRDFGDTASLYLGLTQQTCDVLVLDLELPGEDGTSALQRLRAHEAGARMGIVILTGRCDDATRVRELTLGADAYLAKPTSIPVLAATIRSVARRLPTAAPQATWRIDTDGWDLLAPCGKRVTLTATERLLLTCLLDARGEVVERETLIAALGHRTDYYSDHRLDVVVSRLRRKVIARTGQQLPLRTLHGRGLMISPAS